MMGLALIMQGAFLCEDAVSSTQTVVVEGMAPMIQDDRVQARDEALADARIRAIEQVAGVRIEAKAVFSQELMLDSTLVSSSEGLILEEKILSEAMDDTGIYHLKLEAAVSTDHVKKRLKSLLRDDRIVLHISETNLDQAAGFSILANRLTQQLNQNGYLQIIHSEINADPALTRSSPDSFSITDAEKLGIGHLADIVIAGHIQSRASAQFGENLFSAHAEGWVRVFAINENRLLTSPCLSNIKGFGANPEQAGRDALANITHQLCEQVLNHVAQRSFRQLEVVVYDIPDFDQFKKFKNMLSLMRWVQQVETSGFSQAKTRFNIQYAQQPEILASRLQMVDDLSVLRFDSQCIEVKVKEKAQH